MMKHQKVEQNSEFDSDSQALNETQRNEADPDCVESQVNAHEQFEKESFQYLSRQVSEDSMAHPMAFKKN